MATKLVIFDLDGTLLNTITDLAVATNTALSQLGFPTHDEDAYKLFVGNGIDVLFERALPENEKTEVNVKRMRDIFLPFYNEHNRDATAPYPGIVDALQSLKSRGVKIAVASNKYHEGALATMQGYFSEIEFDVIFGHREGYNPKPDPAVVFDILEICGVEDKTEVLYVGDTAVDMQTAKNAEVPAVAVTWGFRSEEELRACNPEYVIHNPEELLGIAIK